MTGIQVTGYTHNVRIKLPNVCKNKRGKMCMIDGIQEPFRAMHKDGPELIRDQLTRAIDY